MLLITCPWCGARDEVEFRYGGQAHLAYPDDPETLYLRLIDAANVDLALAITSDTMDAS